MTYPKNHGALDNTADRGHSLQTLSYHIANLFGVADVTAKYGHTRTLLFERSDDISGLLRLQTASIDKYDVPGAVLDHPKRRCTSDTA